MPTYRAPVKDMLFVLNDVLNITKYSNIPGYADATPDLVSAILEEGGKFCENELAPLNLSGDQEGCTRHEDGSVTTATTLALTLSVDHRVIDGALGAQFLATIVQGLESPLALLA